MRIARCYQFILIVFVAFVIVAACGSEPTPTVAPVPTVTLVATVALVPTRTPASTRTPVPTRDLAPISPQESAYLEWFDDISSRVSKSNDLFDDAISSVRDGSSGPGPRLVIAREVLKLGDFYYEEATEKTPPLRLIGVHDGLINALDAYKAVSDGLQEGSLEDFLIGMDEGKKLFFDSGTIYRQWRSIHN